MNESNEELTLQKKLLSPVTLVTLVTILIAISISAVVTYGKLVTAEEVSQLKKLVNIEAIKRATTIAQYIDDQQKQIELFASRSSFQTITQGASEGLIKTAMSSLKAAYPNALSMRLYSLDREELINVDSEPLSFTELDMINQAEKNIVVRPEILNQGQSRFLLIRPVVSTTIDAVSGTLLLALPSTELFKLITDTDKDEGHTELLRSSQPKPISLFTTGIENSQPSADTKVDGSHWLVRFSPSPKLIQQTSVSSFPVVAIHLLLIILLMPAAFILLGQLDPKRKPKIQQLYANAARIKKGPQRNEMLDVKVAAEDTEVLDLQETEVHEVTQSANEFEGLPNTIFRSYDIRGIALDEITPKLAAKIGQAVASEVLAAGEDSMYVGRDGRTHSPELCEGLIEGILSTGCNVLNLGVIPTPLMYFATCEFSDSNSGIIVTASHNAAQYNGFKMVVDGTTLAADQILQIKSRIQRGDFYQGDGEVTEQSVATEYIDRIFADIALAGDVKIVVDASNGATSKVAPQLFEELGCEVVPLFCEMDGSFPNHDPDPTREENLQALIAEVKRTEADLGVALDGDGDRLVIVTQTGQIIWPDRLLMMFAKDIVSRHPGSDVVYDVKCTRELSSIVRSYGGRPIMWKTGHSHLKAKMKQTGALIGGEFSGHIFIKDRWYGFDDGMYATARLLEIMTLRDQDADSLFASFPTLPATPEILVPVAEDQKFKIVEMLIARGEFQNGKATTIDGLRVDFTKGWGLVRASNTSAALTMRFEAEEQQVIEQIQSLFKRELEKVDPSIQLPF